MTGHCESERRKDEFSISASLVGMTVQPHLLYVHMFEERADENRPLINKSFSHDLHLSEVNPDGLSRASELQVQSRDTLLIIFYRF